MACGNDSGVNLISIVSNVIANVVSLNKLEKLWKHRALVAVGVSGARLVFFPAVYSFLADMKKRPLGVTLRDNITIDNIYARCNAKPASVQVANARWRLFGNVLRMNENVGARQAITCYFNCKRQVLYFWFCYF